jgi:hypothetical protein
LDRGFEACSHQGAVPLTRFFPSLPGSLCVQIVQCTRLVQVFRFSSRTDVCVCGGCRCEACRALMCVGVCVGVSEACVVVSELGLLILDLGLSKKIAQSYLGTILPLMTM